MVAMESSSFQYLMAVWLAQC